MSANYPLFHEFAADLADDKRILLADAALEKFDPREQIHIATALLIDANAVLKVTRASYALNGWVVTVEYLRGA